MQPREITGHEVKGEPITIRVVALDLPDDSGASHHYRYEREDGAQLADLQFHVGEIDVFSGMDMNGVTMEALIVTMIDRIKGFQSGLGKHKQYEFARKRLEEALAALKVKTEEDLEKEKVTVSD
jgi:hypothetical protein